MQHDPVECREYRMGEVGDLRAELASVRQGVCLLFALGVAMAGALLTIGVAGKHHAAFLVLSPCLCALGLYIVHARRLMVRSEARLRRLLEPDAAEGGPAAGAMGLETPALIALGLVAAVFYVTFAEPQPDSRLALALVWLAGWPAALAWVAALRPGPASRPTAGARGARTAKPIRFRCPLCGAELRASAARAGERRQCGSCKKMIRVPVPGAGWRAAGRVAAGLVLLAALGALVWWGRHAAADLQGEPVEGGPLAQVGELGPWLEVGAAYAIAALVAVVALFGVRWGFGALAVCTGLITLQRVAATPCPWLGGWLPGPDMAWPVLAQSAEILVLTLVTVVLALACDRSPRRKPAGP